MKKALSLLLALCLILALCACGSSGAAETKPTAEPLPSAASAAEPAPEAAPEATPEPTPEPTSEPTPDPEAEAAAVLDEAKALIDGEEYYEAALRILACQTDYPDSEAAAGAAGMLDELAELLKDNQPKTGELERNFPYWGKSCVKAKAESAPFEMIIRDTKNESQYTRFFVRQGDTSEIYLPNGVYTVFIRQGPIWFNDEIGFGELCESSDFGGATLDMGSSSDGTILNWHEWSPTF